MIRLVTLRASRTLTFVLRSSNVRGLVGRRREYRRRVAATGPSVNSRAGKIARRRREYRREGNLALVASRRVLSRPPDDDRNLQTHRINRTVIGDYGRIADRYSEFSARPRIVIYYHHYGRVIPIRYARCAWRATRARLLLTLILGKRDSRSGRFSTQLRKRALPTPRSISLSEIGSF